MVLNPGDKILAVHRRLFEADMSRYFVGVVDAYDSGIVKVTGWSWVKDQYSGMIVEKSEQRTKIIPLNSGTFFVYQLADDVDVDRVTMQHDGVDQTLVLRLGERTVMDLTEKLHVA